LILYVKNRFQTIIAGLGIADVSQPEKLVDSFLESLNDDQRVLFDCTFARSVQNHDTWKDKENSFTANRLLADTQDFCLFNEDFLKSKLSQTELQSRAHWELANLIVTEFSGTSIRSCSAVGMSDLDTKLSSELSRRNDKERCLRILLMLRNYSSHNVKGGRSSNYFCSHCDEILAELVRATCYIALLSTPP
jgi:predicted ATP-dependent endonuclease of OLD family